ncbi:hypothetical protein [Nocardia macrotermitis]|uniref:Uncharacterized protein n=1 Tax=Nocardia macrotermitis TaxID=2585198 RepID=A0A7K0DA62_9NOCA|nr:hypothetical protein [Nocardia macrotermitis]MQY22499.1 hypothetical protein [Nocardia macrotermitis]
MTVNESEWLITSDRILEVAFRVDLPESHRGMWLLSYLPTRLRLTREQAVVGMTLAEIVLTGQLDETDELLPEIAHLYADRLGFTLADIACMLALRSSSDLGCEVGCTSVQGERVG